MLKRITALILVLTLMLTSLPLPAAATEDQASVNADNTTIESTNTLGSLLAEDISQEDSGAESNYESGYAIYDLVVEDSTAMVTFDTKEEANLLVCIYDEESMRLLASANTIVTADTTSATLEFTDALPGNFYAEVFLLDNYDYSPLCASLDCPLYTTEMQELLNSTVADYDPEQVLNLDSSDETNFLVCGDDTQLIDQVEGVNVVTFADDETMTYVVENADETFTSLTAGDTVVYPYNDNGDVLIVNVADISVDGTTVTITGADVELTDVFSHIKISETADMNSVELSQDDMNDGVEYLGFAEDEIVTFVSGSGSKNRQLGFKLSVVHEDSNNLKTTIDGEIKLGVDAEFEYYLSWDRQYVILKNNVTASLKISVTGEIYPDPNYLTKNPIPFHLGTTGLVLQIHPKFTFSFSGAVGAEIDLTVPMIATFRNGSLKFSMGKVGSNLGEMQAEVTFFVGFDLEPAIVAINENVLKLELSVPIGLKIKISSSKSALNIAYPSERHTCEICFAIEANLGFEAKVIIKCLNSKLLSAELTLLECWWKFAEGYWSVDHEEAAFDYPPVKCPHREYRVNIYTIGSDIMPADDAVLYCDGEELECVLNGGIAITYLPVGSYLFSAYFPRDEATVHEARAVTKSIDVTLTTSQEYLDRLEEVKKFRIEPDLVKKSDDLDGGKIGDSIEWVLYHSGALVLSGEGEIPSYFASSDTPWYKYKEYITSIEIGNGITSIGQYAFGDLSKVTKVIIADSVTKIYRGTFQNLTALKEIRMPVDLNFSGWTGTYSSGDFYSAYSGTTNVEKIHYTKGQTNSMLYRNSNTRYDYSTATDAFYGRTLEYISRDSLKTVYFDDGITSIASYAFYNTTALEDMYIPVTVTSIGSYAFYDSEIDHIDLPLALTSLGEYAFYSCDKLTEIILPQTLTVIPQYCFQGCTGLTELVIPNGVTILYRNSITNCTGLKSVTMPVDVKFSSWTGTYSSGNYYSAFEGTTNVEEIHYTYGQTGTMRGRSDDNHFTYSTEEDYFYGRTLEYISRETLKRVTFEDGITSIGGHAFYDTTALVEVTIPDTVTSIGSYAFYNSEISHIDLPPALANLGEYAFYSCDKLTEIILPQTLTVIPQYCFQGCTGLTELVIPNGVTILYRNSITNCTGLKSVTMPVDVKFSSWTGTYSSGNYYSAFEGTTNVEEIHYTYGQTGAMRGRSDDNHFTYSTEEDYFYGRTLEYISREHLRRVTFEDGITSIGGYVFYDTMVSEVQLPDTLQSIGLYAFYSCDNLTSIDLPLGLSSIGAYGFYGSGLTELYIPETMSEISSNCFQNCRNLSSITLPDTVRKLNYDAFSGCTALKSVTMPIDLNFSSYDFTGYGEFVSAFDGTPNVESIRYTPGETGAMYFRGTSNTSSYINPDYYYCRSLEYISRSALKTVSFDEGITSIAALAFTQSALSEVWFHGDMPTISSNSFSGVTATMYYPADNATWSGVSGNYGGTLTWVGCDRNDSGELIPFSQVDTVIPEEQIPEEAVVATEEDPPVEANPEPVKTTSVSETEIPASSPETSAKTSTALDSLVVYGVFDGDHSSDKTENYSIHTATFSDLVPGEQYVLLVMADLEAEDPLSSSNLLYAAQDAAAADGTLIFEYVQKHDTDYAYVVACGPTNQNLKDAVVTFPTVYSSEAPMVMKPTVTYKGEILTEQLDYVLTGNYIYTEAGTYSCAIRGIYNYTGQVECSYNVLDYIYVTDIELSRTDVILAPGETYNLTTTVTPENAINPMISWISSDEKVATVDENGLITAVSEGVAKITAASTDGSGILAVCTVTVSSSLAITSQPTDYVGLVGDMATFTVVAEGEGLTYQWYFYDTAASEWKKSSGNTSATMSVEFKAYRVDQEYRCEITDADGNTVTTDVVRIVAKVVPLVITAHPADHVGAVNDNVSMTVEATGNGLTYQWYYSTDGGVTWAKSGSPGFATANLQPILRAYRDGYQFYCLVTDIFGNTAQSNVASMTVKASEVVITKAPVVVNGAKLGELYYFEAEATGDNLEYRWEFSSDGGETWQLSWNQGYNTATLGVRMNANRDGYLYRCKITSGLKTVVYTEPVSLNLQEPSAVIVGQSGNVAIIANKTATFTVDAEGTDLSYLWYRSNDKGATWTQTYLSGYNTDTLSFVGTAARAAMYMCKVTDGSGKAIWSSPVKLQILSAELKILSQPESVTCASGATAIFTVEAQGDGLKYQWYASSDDGATWTASYLGGYNTDTLSFSVTAARAAKLYKCVITDASGNTVETNAVSVTIG